MKLFMIILGGNPIGRLIEQHDVFFGVGDSLAALAEPIAQFWPGVKIHIDSWREVTVVDNCHITIVPKDAAMTGSDQLFFFNLGGYKENDLEEYHYKVLTVADSLANATKNAKTSSFYKHLGFKGANSHIDEKYGIDVDDFYNIADILSAEIKEKYALQITKSDTVLADDPLHIGYLPLRRLLI